MLEDLEPSLCLDVSRPPGRPPSDLGTVRDPVYLLLFQVVRSRACVCLAVATGRLARIGGLIPSLLDEAAGTGTRN
jgi:hypothetical protein